MAINTTNHPERKDNTTLWIILAVIVAAILAYATYASYYGNRYETTTSFGSVTNEVNPPATTTP